MYVYFNRRTFAFDPVSAFRFACFSAAAYLDDMGQLETLKALSGAEELRIVEIDSPLFPRVQAWRFGSGWLYSCEGTSELSQWIFYLWRSFQIVYGNVPGKVLQAFADLTNGMANTIQSTLPEAGKLGYLFTGHSLGGAMALLLSAVLPRYGYESKLVYTFGSPRVGNKVFADRLYRDHIRVVVDLDTVPEVPFTRSVIWPPLIVSAFQSQEFVHHGIMARMDLGRLVTSQRWHDGLTRNLTATAITELAHGPIPSLHRMPGYFLYLKSLLNEPQRKLLKDWIDWSAIAAPE